MLVYVCVCFCFFACVCVCDENALYISSNCVLLSNCILLKHLTKKNAIMLRVISMAFVSLTLVFSCSLDGFFSRTLVISCAFSLMVLRSVARLFSPSRSLSRVFVSRSPSLSLSFIHKHLLVLALSPLPSPSRPFSLSCPPLLYRALSVSIALFSLLA